MGREKKSSEDTVLVCGRYDTVERARLDVLASYAILDTPAERAFDDLARLATILCQAPIALVSLIDEGRQWFKANVGLEGVSETPRSQAFCAYTIHGSEPLIVPDATVDARFSKNPLVTQEPKIRFYAGVPLTVSSDVRLGSLCVIDTVARPQGLSALQVESLEALARAVVDQIELRRELCERRKAEERLRDRDEWLGLAQEVGGFVSFDWDLTTDCIRLSDRNGAIFGAIKETITTPGEVLANIHPEDRAKYEAELSIARAQPERREFEYRAIDDAGESRWVRRIAQTLFGSDGRPLRVLGVCKDIDDRKRNEIELVATRERLALAMDGGNDGLWDWNIATGEVWVSDHRAWMLGYEPSEIENHIRAWEQLIHPDDLDLVRSVVSEHFEGRSEIYLVEHRVRRKDGSWKWIQDRGKVVSRSESGIPLRALGVHSDIDRRKAAEDGLRESEARLRLAFEAAGIGAWETDLVTGRPLLSPESLAMFELPTHQAVELESAEAWAQLIHPEDRERALAAAHAAATAGGLYDVTFRVPRLSGGPRWVQGIGRAQYDKAGRPSKLVGINIDVTSAKEAELELRQSQESLSLALDIGHLATFDWSINGGDVHWSDGHFTLLGYQVGEVEPSYTAWAARVHPDDLAATEARLQHAQETGDDYNSEYRVLLPDGSVVWLEGLGRVFKNMDDLPSRMIGIIRDITARKRSEAAAIKAQADDLRVSRLSAMGAMASTLAHELNQPLTAANNYLSIASVLMQEGGTRGEAVAGAISRAQSQTKRIDDIIRRMRVFTVTGEIASRAEPVSPMVQAALANLQERLSSERIAVVTKGLEKADPVLVDRVQIEQVLGNLLRNAVDVLAEIDSAERAIEVKACRNGPMLELRISDNGPGLRSDMLHNVFNLFQTNKENGMGLGLPLCRTIVEAHGGRIWAEQPTESGAVFVLSLPAAAEAAASS